MKIKKNSVLLFQGDSVTDCHRNRENDLELGDSFVPMIATELSKFNVKVINRAIAGNKVNDLLDRFDRDFKDVNPDSLVLLIGVNDTWHNYPNSKPDDVFEKEYDLLLSKIKNEMNCNVLLMEPFIMGYKEEYTVMRKDLLGKIEVLNPITTIKRGYSIVRMNNKSINSINDVKTGDRVNIEISDGNINAIIE